MATRPQTSHAALAVLGKKPCCTDGSSSSYCKTDLFTFDCWEEMIWTAVRRNRLLVFVIIVLCPLMYHFLLERERKLLAFIRLCISVTNVHF